uniref:NAD(P)H dehydrogenase subunit H n=1 Tax=Spirodela intermedia TaxID=51605 RepID=A0A8S0XAB0_SPIIN
MTGPATRNDLMIVNMGPQHPSMHGVLRLIVTLDGEDVIDCEPILENRTIVQYLPYVTRWDYLATMFTEAITVNAPEQLGNIQVPQRASYIRVIMLELSRIASHLLWLGPFMADIGAQTPFSIFLERELIYDLFEAATGMRMMHNYFRIGGVAADLPYGWIDKLEAPKGELGIFLIGDQNVFPWRWKIRPPGFINLQILPQLVKRMKLADIMTILGSIDIIMGEVDR